MRLNIRFVDRIGIFQEMLLVFAERRLNVVAVEVDLPLSAFQLLSLAPDDRITYAVFAPDGGVITGYDDQVPLPDNQTFGIDQMPLLLHLGRFDRPGDLA